jgi:glutathione S-transferase
MHLYGDAMHALVMKKWRNTPDTDHTKQALQDLPKWFGILNTHLTGKEYMVGGRFTLADINVMSVVNGTGFIEYDISAFSEVKRWHSILMQREAVKRVLTA